jgi:hypothetical protein
MAKKKRPKPKQVLAEAAPEPNVDHEILAASENAHSSSFALMLARSKKFQLPPFCFREFDDGSAQVCRLLGDGSYGDCQPYFGSRPVPGPKCG